MVPPMRGSVEHPENIPNVVEHLKVDPTSPLGEWNSEASYDTAKEGRAGLEQNIKDKEHLHFATVGERRAVDTQAQLAQCIATDDPRLKAK